MMTPRNLHISGFALPIVSLATNTGWTNKPTARSDTARPKYRALNAACSQEALLRDINIRMFPMIAARDRSELKTELITREPVINGGSSPWYDCELHQSLNVGAAVLIA